MVVLVDDTAPQHLAKPVHPHREYRPTLVTALMVRTV
jgi:hypothetical protein